MSRISGGTCCSVISGGILVETFAWNIYNIKYAIPAGSIYLIETKKNTNNNKCNKRIKTIVYTTD